jgi:hypothetical protein
MRIIKLLNTISPEIYFNNIFECLFGSREYRIRQSFLIQIENMKEQVSLLKGNLSIDKEKLLQNKSFKIICQKPFFFKQNFNSFQNMNLFKSIIINIYKKIHILIKHTNYQTYNTNIIISKNVISIEK